MAPRKSVDQELTRERILKVARELFVTKGFSQVSMRMLAKELQYSHGALYYHFTNKAELFHALVLEDFKLLQHKLEDILALDVDRETKLEFVLLGYIQFGLEHQSHYEIMFLTKDEGVHHLLKTEPNMVYDMFAQAVVSLSQLPLEVKQVWSVFLALHGFVTHYCKTGLTYQDIELIARSHVQFILKGIS